MYELEKYLSHLDV